ncbi:hypothetical protein IFM89_016279 [Coptis chinensis]|uniref:Aminotransferase-like plant mobile domain-containing protein n=1 Tax=Coptis chinensis TaxID=261450 RepID=A0A835LME6_9MAGN|nr:hypothetical protein IFM89_016279 [Coptis chinensis]
MINCMIFVVMPPKTRENLEESNSIDCQEGAQEYSDKAFILSLKKKKEKAKSPDVREEYPKEGPLPRGPTIDSRDSVLRWYYEHVSFFVWLGKERGVLKTHQHAMKMLAWVVEGKYTTFWQKVALDDIKQFTGLPIRSEALVGKVNIKKVDVKQLLVQGLSPAITEAEIDEELDDCGSAGKVVSLGWLRSKLHWLWYDLNIFRHGYMSIFLASGHPYNSEYTIDMPRMKRWLVRTSTGDLMTSGCLCCLDDLAAYHPDRVLHQFGRVQGIPLEPLIPELDVSTPHNYKIIYPNIQGHQWSQWFNHVLNETMRGTTVVDSSDCDPKYIEWYYSVSHPHVQDMCLS